MQQENRENAADFLKRRFEGIEGVEVIDEQFEVCAAEVCDHFGGCANCKGFLLTHELNSSGDPVGPARLFLCTHSCHRASHHRSPAAHPPDLPN